MTATWSDIELQRIVAADIPAGAVVNLGIGMPLGLGNHLALMDAVTLHSENGILGMGSEVSEDEQDPDLVNAGKQYVSLTPGAAITDQVESFTIARRGFLDIAVLGAYQVSSSGDLANWKRPGQVLAGVGGAVDIAAGANDVWVMMKARARDGSPKLVTECTYPLSAKGVVTRVYTELGVLEPQGDHFAATRVPAGAQDSDLNDVLAAPLVLATT